MSNHQEYLDGLARRDPLSVALDKYKWESLRIYDTSRDKGEALVAFRDGLLGMLDVAQKKWIVEDGRLLQLINDIKLDTHADFEQGINAVNRHIRYKEANEKAIDLG